MKLWWRLVLVAATLENRLCDWPQAPWQVIEWGQGIDGTTKRDGNYTPRLRVSAKRCWICAEYVIGAGYLVPFWSILHFCCRSPLWEASFRIRSILIMLMHFKSLRQICFQFHGVCLALPAAIFRSSLLHYEYTHVWTISWYIHKSERVWNAAVGGEYLRTSGALEMYDVITGSPTQWFDLKSLGQFNAGVLQQLPRRNFLISWLSWTSTSSSSSSSSSSWPG